MPIHPGSYGQAFSTFLKRMQSAYCLRLLLKLDKLIEEMKMKLLNFKSNKKCSIAFSVVFAIIAAASVNSANAAEIGRVVTNGAYSGPKPTSKNSSSIAWKATWGVAWQTCRFDYKATRSVQLLSHRIEPVPGIANTYLIKGHWACRNTP